MSVCFETLRTTPSAGTSIISAEPSPQVYAALFEEVSEATAEMVAHWMRVGFVHGVMNTDNMSILGLTIDYGPYGWLEDYDPDWTPNTTDAAHRRYRYAQQPQIAHWNLVQLANALHPIGRGLEGSSRNHRSLSGDVQPPLPIDDVSQAGAD